MAFDNDLVDARGAKQECALNADAVGGHAANGDGSVVAALAKADHDALELLNTLAVAFLDLDINADGITWIHLRDFFVWFGLNGLDKVCHFTFFLTFDC